MAFTLIDDDEEQPKTKFTLLDEEESMEAQAPAKVPVQAQGVPFFAQQATEEAPFAPRPEVMRGVTRGFAQGATFNLADELSALLGGDPEKFRAEQEQFAKDYPGYSLGSELAGGLAMGAAVPASLAARFPGAMLTGRAGKLAPYVAPIAAGTAYGAAAGFGVGETMSERLEKATLGAGLGALATPAMQTAAKIISGPFKSVAGWFSNKAAEREGISRLAKTMQEEGLDPSVIQKQVDEMTQQTGKPVMWLDLIDPNKYPKTYDLASKGLLRGTSTEPKMRVIERGEGTTGRLIDDIRARIHGRGEKAYEDVIKSREARQQAWSSAFDPIKNQSVPGAKDILNEPYVRDAVSDAQKMAIAKGDRNALDLFNQHFATDPKTGELVVINSSYQESWI